MNKPLKTLVNQSEPMVGMPLCGRYFVTVERNDPFWGDRMGTREYLMSPNVVVQNGMTMLARYVSSYGVGANSQMVAIGIGTATTAASVNQTTTQEVKRLAFASSSVTAANSWSAVTTYGGGTDSLVGVVIGEAAVYNSVTSGVGIMFNRAPLSTTFTLQSSDVALVQVIVSVGSL